MRLFNLCPRKKFMEKKNKNWKETEKLVQLIEQSLDPNSKVLHDVKLPVLNSPKKRTRQCDCVIISKNGPRETTTLVEVQDRDSKVDITTFGGWLIKLQEVGAQHLICVSRLDFPDSIIEKAAQLGNTVYLIRLKEAFPNNFPFKVFHDQHELNQFQLTSVSEMRWALSKSDAKKFNLSTEELLRRKFGGKDKIFSYDQKNLIDLEQLALDQINSLESDSGEDIVEVCGPPPLYFEDHGNFIQITKLRFKCQWTKKIHKISPTVLSYEEISKGTLAWVVEFHYKDETGEFHLRSVFEPVGEDKYNLSVQVDSSRDLSLKLTILNN